MRDINLKILLVEDNPGDALLFRETLRDVEDVEYDLDHVMSLKEASEILKKGNFDVILLDLNLPDGNGLDNILHIQKWAPKVPIIVLTGLDDEKVAVEALREGAQDYIVKGNPEGEIFWRSMCYAVERKSIEESLQKAKDEAEAATQAKSEFLAHMSHEIRSPLNVILGAAEAVSKTNLDQEQQKLIHIFKVSGDALLSVINDILDLSKLEAGRVEIEKIEFGMHKLISDLKSFFSITAEKKNIKLDFEIHSAVPETQHGDPLRLRQVLFNLLGNAIKFTENGNIELKVGPNPDFPGCLFFSIKDSGIGIPKEQVEAIFESFSQSSSTTTRKFGGTGLGLTICKKLVGLMQGQIWAESEEGEGSTFFFYTKFDKSIPAPLQNGAHTNGNETIQKEGKSEVDLNNLKLLIVDDSEEARWLFKTFLNSTGIKVSEVEGGEQALDLLQNQQFDVVLLDMNMPGMDGYTCATKLREFEKENNLDRTPVIAFTAYTGDDEEKRCHEAGCSDFLSKPVDQSSLINCLGKYKPKIENQKNELDQKKSDDPIIVKKGLQKIVPWYLDKKKKDINTLKDFLKVEEWENIRRLGHNMAGTGVSYGFEKVSSIGYQLENAAMDKKNDEVNELIKELSSFLTNIKVVYK